MLLNVRMGRKVKQLLLAFSGARFARARKKGTITPYTCVASRQGARSASHRVSPNQVLTHAARGCRAAARGAREGLWLEQPQSYWLCRLNKHASFWFYKGGASFARGTPDNAWLANKAKCSSSTLPDVVWPAKR